MEKIWYNINCYIVKIFLKLIKEKQNFYRIINLSIIN